MRYSAELRDLCRLNRPNPWSRFADIAFRHSCGALVSKNQGILLANLCQSSKADISAQDFLGSSVFKEAIYGVKFPALRGSPTVSGRFVRQLDKRRIVLSRGFPRLFGFIFQYLMV